MNRKTAKYILFFIVAAAFFLRVLNAPYIISPEGNEIILTDNDAPYHALRIIDFAKGISSKIQFHDPRSYYPEGHVSHWSPGFDFALGLLGRIFYFAWPNDFALKIFVCLLVPIFGSITLIFYYLLLRSFMNRVASLAGTALLSFLPFHITGTYFSIVDHHVAEYLIIILLYLALARLKNKNGPVIFAIIVTAGFWVIPAFLVDYIFLTMASVFTLILCRLWRGYTEYARKLLVAQILSFSVLLPTLFFSYYGSLFSMRFDSISLFQGVITFIAVVVTGFFVITNSSNNIWLRPPYSVFLSILLVSLVVFSFPGFYEQLQNGLSYMRGSSHLRLSSEYNFMGWERFTAGYLKAFWPFFPLGMAAVCFEAFRKRDILLITLFVPLVFYGLMAFVEVKFFRYFLIFGIIAGIFFCAKLFEITSQIKKIRYSVIFLFIFLIIYGFSDYKKVFLLFKNARNDSAFKTLYFISNNYSRGKDGTTIFALWDLGHKIIYYTSFYNMDNPFLIKEKISHTKDFALFNFSKEENKALSILEKYDSRIVIMESALLQLPIMAPLIEEDPSGYISETGILTSQFIKTINGRLYFFDGTYMTDKSGKDRHIPAVTSLRLIYETKKQIHTGGFKRPFYKVYERVSGANIVFERPSTSSLHELPVLTTTLMTNTGRKFLYVSKAIDANENFFTIKTPYIAPGKNGEITALVPYTLSYGIHTIKVVVKEEDIQKGGMVTATFNDILNQQ